MPKYMIQASYTTQGLEGLMAEGGSARQRAVRDLVESLGGSIEAFYYAFGPDDVVVLADVPDNASAAAASLTASASGAVTARTTPLLTPEEVDQAIQKSPSYRPPGG